MNQHFVPKFYLKYFSVNNESSHIGLYNIASSKYIESTEIRTQAAQKYYYGKDGQVEEWLSDVESNVAPIITNILQTRKLPEFLSEEHLKLIHFLIVLDLRNPVHKHQIVEGFELLKKKVNRDTPNQDSDIMKGLNTVDNDQLFNESILDAHNKVSYLNDLNYKLIRNTSNVPFITSDNPMANYNQFLEFRNWQHSSHNGYGVIGKQIFFPINNEYLMVFYDSGIYKVGTKREIVVEVDCDNEIHQLNIIQFLNCNQNIFFNQLVTHEYIKILVDDTKGFKKGNEPYSKVLPILDETTKTPKSHEEIITIGTSDIKINLSIRKIKRHSKSQHIIFDNRVVQLRPKIKSQL